MLEIIFGTTNPAKIAQAKGALAGMDIDIKGLSEFDNLPKIIEDGKTAQENARKKALGFAKAIGKTVFSMDNALYFDGVNAEEQPGINIRRIKGIEDRPTDKQMIDYYTELAKKYGGEITGHFEFAIAIAKPEALVEETTIKAPQRHFMSKPSPIIIDGYPMESLQVDAKTGKYVSEMTQEEQDKYWQESVGTELKELFSRLIKNS